MITLKQTALEMESDLETVIGLFAARVGARDGILLESAEVDGRWGRYSLAACDFILLARHVAGKLALDINDDRLRPLARYDGLPYLEGLGRVMAELEIAPAASAAGLPPITRALYGYLDYEAAGLVEPRLGKVLRYDRGAEGGFCLPGHVYVFDHLYNRLARLSLMEGDGPVGPAAIPPSPGAVRVGPAQASLPRDGYVKAAGAIRQLIKEGECVQVVLSTRFQAPFQGDLFSVYRHLRRINPSPYMFYLNFPEVSLAVSSPEVMVSCDQGRLRLCPIAGTRPRGATSEEDSLFAEELSSDPKERAEHVMLVDLGRNDLGRVSEPGTVKVDRFMETERFSHVMHLTSRLSGQLKKGLSAVDVIAAAFPAGTLSGAPKVRAMEIIARFEPGPRGPYGGAMGWLGLDKDSVSLDLGITIRGLWRRGGQVYWQAGAGLVYDSVPEREWQECLNKSKAPQTALGDAARGE